MTAYDGAVTALSNTVLATTGPTNANYGGATTSGHGDDFSTVAIAITSPAEGSVIGRATPLQFSIVSSVPFRRVLVSIQLGGSIIEEMVHDGISFAPIYLGGVNSRSNVTIGSDAGYDFNILRLGGWRGSSITLKVIAIDAVGTIGYKTAGTPLAQYTWQIAGGGSGDVTPFIGQGGL